MLQHLQLMYVLETHERRNLITAAAWKHSQFEPLAVWSCLSPHYLLSLWTRQCSFSQRAYQRWHAVYSCWQNRRLLHSMTPTGCGHARAGCFKAQERKNFPFPIFSYPFLHSLSLNRTRLMSWHLFFQFFYHPHKTHTHHHFSSMAALASSCFSFSSPSNVLPAGIWNAPEGTEEQHRPLLSYQETFSNTALRVLAAHCPTFRAKGVRYANKKVPMWTTMEHIKAPELCWSWGSQTCANVKMIIA